MGIKNGADLKRMGREELIQHFGKAGAYYHQIVMGEDNRPVCPQRIRKSVGRETTLGEDIDDLERILEILDAICHDVETRIQRKSFQGKTLTLKVRYHDFSTITRSRTVDTPIMDRAVMASLVRELLTLTEAGRKKVRLLGVTVSKESDTKKTGKFIQPSLPFPELKLPWKDSE